MGAAESASRSFPKVETASRAARKRPRHRPHIEDSTFVLCTDARGI
jgi:hypothetical protein